MAHACNPSTFGGRGGRIIWAQEFETSLGNTVRPCLYWKLKISWVWWQSPVIPVTWEAEEGESLEPGRRRFQWAEITPLHSSLGNRVRLCLQKKKKSRVLLFQRHLDLHSMSSILHEWGAEEQKRSASNHDLCPLLSHLRRPTSYRYPEKSAVLRSFLDFYLQS